MVLSLWVLGKTTGQAAVKRLICIPGATLMYACGGILTCLVDPQELVFILSTGYLFMALLKVKGNAIVKKKISAKKFYTPLSWFLTFLKRVHALIVRWKHQFQTKV